MDTLNVLVLISLAIFLFGLFSKLSENSIVSAPMVFTLLGIFVCPIGANIIDLEMDHEILEFIGEIALVSILFTDGSKVNTKSFFKNNILSIKLLIIGLPISIGLGFIFAHFLFPEYSLLFALILAIILAPTDAALGLPVIKNKAIPEKIRRT